MKKIFIISALLGAMIFTSCESFLDINKSKDSAISTSVDQVLPVATFYASQLCYDHAEYGVYMCQALTTGGKSQTGSYPYSQGWEFLGVNRHPMWRRHFYDLGANIQKMNEIACYEYNPTTGEYEMNWNLPNGEDKRIPRPNAVLIGRTIMLMSTMFTTDAFGDMPRSQVYQSNSPRYDTQAEVYEWMFREADELVSLYADPKWVNAETNLNISTTMDRIYGGDMNKWACFCKALRARLWLRKLPNWDNTPANCDKIIAMVDEVLNDANWEEPRYHYDGGVTESNCPWGPLAPKINSWESRDNRLDESIPTTFFLHGILGSIDGTYKESRGHALDPRANKIMEPRTSTDNAGNVTQIPMRHLESNIGMTTKDLITDFPDLLTQTQLSNPYTQNMGYIPLITEEELMFIKAEAQYWKGDITGAYNTTYAATEFNMLRYGIVKSQLAYDPNKFGDPLRQYNRFFNIKLPNAITFTIADLMQQKYVAMYLQPEQWTDMRRYNYSSSTNGISYARPGQKPVFVYDVKNVHNRRVAEFHKDSANFSSTYALRRPFNLYEAYWCTSDDYGTNAYLSPNAWVNRLNADTETETKYNKKELDRMGYYTTNAAGEKILDYRILKKRLIWAYNTSGMAQSADPNITWN